MTIGYGEILALSKKNSLKYGSIGIDYIDATPTGNGIRFYLVDGAIYDIPISTMNFMFKAFYDTNDNGNADKADKLQLKDGSIIFNTGEELLNRTNHTGTQKAETVTLDKTNFNEFLSEFAGTTVQQLADYLNTHKEFINGLFVGDSTTDGSFKFAVNNSKLEILRRENGVWNTVQVIGSTATDNIILTKDYSSIVYKENDSHINVVNQSALVSDGLRFSDPRMEKTYICGNSIEHVKYVNSTLYDLFVQTETLETSNTNTISFDYTTPVLTSADLSLAVEQFKINNVAPITSVSITITEKITGREVYRTYSDFEVAQGLADNITNIGEQQLPLEKPAFLVANRIYTYTIKAKNPIQFLGKTVNGVFIPFLIFKYKRCIYLPFITKNNVSDSVTLNSSDYVASSKALNDVRKTISSAISGVTPMGFISCSDFNALMDGNNGQLYFMSDNGIIGATSTVTQGSWVMINTDFTARAVTDNDFSYSVSDSKAKAPIFILNVEPMTYGKNVQIVRKSIPDEETIANVTTDDSNALKVTVEWDRNSDYYQGVPEINGIGITSAIKNGDTYTGSCIITDFTDNITASLGNGSYIVPLVIENPPVVSSANFSSTYPTTNGILQTELAEDNLMPLTVVADKAFTKVEVYDYLAGKNTILDVTEGTSATVNVTIANRGNTSQSLSCKVRVCSVNGFWSESHISENTVVLNNTKPSMIINSTIYSNGLSAVKDTESATINFTLTNTDTVTPLALTDDFSIGTQTVTSLLVTRLVTGSINYNDGSSNNISFTLFRNTNGTSVVVPTCVFIANVAPMLINASSIPKIRTGENNPVLCAFDQKVKITACSIVTPDRGTLTTGALPTVTYDINYTPYISVVDTDLHSNNDLTMTLTVTGMSGYVTVISKYYIVCGFQQTTINIIYPSITATIPTIVNMSSLIISGFINSDTPYNICIQYVNPPVLVSDYSITSNTLNLPPLSVLGGFNYSATNPITIIIEETI